MVKRLADVCLASFALLIASPLFVLIAFAIWIDDRCPVLYRSQRAGRFGSPFTILKFRTMYRRPHAGGAVSAADDSRITRVGKALRASKADELPQLINVVRGDMSIVGPRPEDVDIVEERYTLAHWETLQVRPGLASPGSIYNYTHGEAALTGPDPMDIYLDEVLPTKLALERVYVRRASATYDCKIIARTVSVIVQKSLGRMHFPDPPELTLARGCYLEPVLGRGGSDARS